MIIKEGYETLVLPHLHSIKFWIMEGLDEREIAQRLGVSSRTLSKYKKEYEPLKKALLSGREEMLMEVEKALLKKATGYKYTEEKTVDKGDKQETTVTTKEVPPDLSAISFLLKNYYPEKWGDKDISQSEEKTFGGVVILPDIVGEGE